MWGEFMKITFRFAVKFPCIGKRDFRMKPGSALDKTCMVKILLVNI